MRTKSRLFGGLASALILSVAGGALAYEGAGYSGGMCHTVQDLAASRHGYVNNSPSVTDTGTPVTCPISYPFNGAEALLYTVIQLDGFDGSSSAVNQCYPHSYSAQMGIDFLGPTKQMCTMWGGCNPGDSNTYTGRAVLAWGGDAAYLGLRINSTPAVRDYSNTGLFCQFNGASEVHAYRFYK
jgi:hypothetical protein